MFIANRVLKFLLAHSRKHLGGQNADPPTISWRYLADRSKRYAAAGVAWEWEAAQSCDRNLSFVIGLFVVEHAI